MQGITSHLLNKDTFMFLAFECFLWVVHVHVHVCACVRARPEGGFAFVTLWILLHKDTISPIVIIIDVGVDGDKSSVKRSVHGHGVPVQ